MRPDRRGWIVAPAVCVALTGCGSTPHNFRRINDPAPIVRARSVSLSEGLPEGKVVPALIDKLEDKDPVVRLAAAEELRQGTGRSFGFVPWAGEPERKAAVGRWREWWSKRQESLARMIGVSGR